MQALHQAKWEAGTVQLYTDSNISKTLIENATPAGNCTPNAAISNLVKELWRFWNGAVQLHHVRSHTGLKDPISSGNEAADRAAAVARTAEKWPEFQVSAAWPNPNGSLLSTFGLKEPLMNVLETRDVRKLVKSKLADDRVNAWKQAEKKDAVQLRQRYLHTRIHLDKLLGAISVVTKTLELLKYRRWKRWLLSWALCLIGGYAADRTEESMDYLTEFIIGNDWDPDRCRVSNEEFPLLNPHLLPPQRHLYHQGPRPPDQECAACGTLRHVSRLLQDLHWPGEVDNQLHGWPNLHLGRVDLGGLLYCVGALVPDQDENTIDDAANLLFNVLLHLYPGWRITRARMWQTWQEAEEHITQKEACQPVDW